MDTFNIDDATIEEYCAKLSKRKEIIENRFNKFENWLENNDFDRLLYRIILEHGDEYESKCYENGYEPYPNNKMNFIFNYVTERGGKQVNIKEFDCPFANQIWEFMKYYFQIIWGQGVAYKIYNKEDSREIFSI